jgi:hypothetical protein
VIRRCFSGIAPAASWPWRQPPAPRCHGGIRQRQSRRTTQARFPPARRGARQRLCGSPRAQPRLEPATIAGNIGGLRKTTISTFTRPSMARRLEPEAYAPIRGKPLISCARQPPFAPAPANRHSATIFRHGPPPLPYTLYSRRFGTGLRRCIANRATIGHQGVRSGHILGRIAGVRGGNTARHDREPRCFGSGSR